MMGLSRMGKACQNLEKIQASEVDWKIEVAALEEYLDPSLLEMKQYIRRRRMKLKAG
jgi:hypothetical protein